MRNILKNSILTILLFVAIGSFPHVVSAQKVEEKAMENITLEQAQNYVGFLADDLLQGRDAGMPGGRIAARYIVSLLKEWGIVACGVDGYYQPFEAVHVTNPDRGAWEIHPDSIARIKGRGAHNLRNMNNILAMIPGERADEFVVVGAHYDHLGFACDIAYDGCYNGADDNASGVSAVLQIAKAMKLSGKKPLRTIIFAFWDGEEKGLLGSKYFVANLSNPDRIKAYMNFDMIGRGPESNPMYMKYFYTEAHPAFGEWLRADMDKHGFCFAPDYRPWDNPVGGSDNGSFAKVGVPIVWYHTDGHADYHRPSDSADKVDYKKLLDITRAAFLCAWRMANEENY